MNDAQRQIARKLVELLTKAHYISVWQDEDYLIKQSHDVDDVLAVMGQGVMNTLEIDRPPDTDDEPYQGSIYLYYHDGTIVFDDDVRPAIEPIIDQVKDFAASLTVETTS